MRRLALISFAFSAAVFISQYCLIKMLPLFAGTGAALIMLVFLLIKNEKVRPAKYLALGLALGFLWCFGYDIIYVQPIKSLDQVTGRYTALVTDFPRDTDYGYSMDIKLNTENGLQIKSLLYVSGEGYIKSQSGVLPMPGDIIEIEAKAKLPQIKNGEDYYTPKGVLLLLYSKQSPEITGHSNSIVYWPVRLAELLNQTAEKIFSPEVYPFMKALLTGDRSDLNKDSFLLSSLSTTGTAHMVAVSGMHLVFLVGLIRFIGGKGKKTALICIPLILFYMAMVGNTPSVTRAGIMQIMLLAAPLLMRDYDRLTALGFSLMLLLFINPMSARHAGLQMSFAAVLGIVLFAEKLNSYIREYISKKKTIGRLCGTKLFNPIQKIIVSSFSLTVSAMVFVIPLTAVNFGLVSLIAPLTNLLILPVLSLAFSLGVFITAIGAFCPQAGSLLSFIVELPVRYILWIVKLLAGLPFTALYSRNIYISAWMVYFYALLGTVVFSRKLRKKPLWLIFPSAALLVVSLCLTYLQAGKYPLTVTMLDVGQGQSIVLASYGRTAVIDCGGNRMKNAGDNVSEYIMSFGKSKLDMLILTHYHSDHVNGAIQMLKRLDVETLVIPDIYDPEGNRDAITLYAQENGTKIVEIKTDTHFFELEAMKLSVFPPLGKESANERGLCVLCTSGEFDMLITGDIDAKTEYMLLEYTRLPDLELLVAGHHGSKYSTSEDLLEVTKPEIVMISTGYNTYGHPSEDLLDRLYKAGIKVYRTDVCGEISIRLN